MVSSSLVDSACRVYQKKNLETPKLVTPIFLLTLKDILASGRMQPVSYRFFLELALHNNISKSNRILLMKRSRACQLLFRAYTTCITLCHTGCKINRNHAHCKQINRGPCPWLIHCTAFGSTGRTCLVNILCSVRSHMRTYIYYLTQMSLIHLRHK